MLWVPDELGLSQVKFVHAQRLAPVYIQGCESVLQVDSVLTELVVIVV